MRGLRDLGGAMARMAQASAATRRFRKMAARVYSDGESGSVLGQAGGRLSHSQRASAGLLKTQPAHLPEAA
jgi:hypothetical protein